MADDDKKKKKDDSLFVRMAKAGYLGSRAKVSAEEAHDGTLYEKKKKEKK